MGMVDSGTCLSFVVEFVVPKQGEPDFLWENFQDVILVHTDEHTLEVPLKAVRYGADAEKSSFNHQSKALEIFRQVPDKTECLGALRQNTPGTEVTLSPNAESKDSTMYNPPDELSTITRSRSRMQTTPEPVPCVLAHASSGQRGSSKKKAVESVNVDNLADAKSVITMMRLKNRSKVRPTAQGGTGSSIFSNSSTQDKSSSACSSISRIDPGEQEIQDLQDFQGLINTAKSQAKVTEKEEERAFYQAHIRADMKNKKNNPPSHANTHSQYGDGSRGLGMGQASEDSDDSYSSDDCGDEGAGDNYDIRGDRRTNLAATKAGSKITDFDSSDDGEDSMQTQHEQPSGSCRGASSSAQYSSEEREFYQQLITQDRKNKDLSAPKVNGAGDDSASSSGGSSFAAELAVLCKTGGQSVDSDIIPEEITPRESPMNRRTHSHTIGAGRNLRRRQPWDTNFEDGGAIPDLSATATSTYSSPGVPDEDVVSRSTG
jgi:hypothetical protein